MQAHVSLLLAALAGAWMAAACEPIPAVLVLATEEQLQSGLLRLDESGLRARVKGRTLEVTVPAVSAAPSTVRLEVALRRLDDALESGTSSPMRGDQPLTLVLDSGADLADPVERARRILHVRVSGGPGELRSRRSVVALLESVRADLQVPARFPVGVDIPLATALPAGSSAVPTADRGTVAGTVAAPTLRVDTPGPVTVTLRAETDGVPVQVRRQAEAVVASNAVVVVPQPSVAPGQRVEVWTWGDLGATHARLRDGAGVLLGVAPLRWAGPLGRAVLQAPWSEPAGWWRVEVADDRGVLGSQGVAVGAPGAFWGAVNVRTRTSAQGVFTVRVDAEDGLARPLPGGLAEVQVVRQGRVVLEASGALVGGAFEVSARAEALVGPLLTSGSVGVHARVTSERGGARSAVAWAPVGAAALQVVAQALPCGADGPCLVRLWAADGEGLPVVTTGLADDGTRAWPASTGADGAGSVEAADVEDGSWWAVALCAADGRCGHAEAVVVRGGDALAPAPVGWTAGEGAPAAERGVRVVTAADGKPGSRFLTGGGSPVVPSGRAWVEDALEDGEGALVRWSSPVAVRPPAGVAPVVDGADVSSSVAGAAVLAQQACGPDQGAWMVAAGLNGGGAAWPFEQGAAERQAGLPAGLPTGAGGTLRDATMRSTAPEQVPLVDRVAGDLDDITREAQALAREGTLTATRLADWISRRSAAYVDAFGARYRLFASGGDIHLLSAGPDERRNTADDVEATGPLERLLGAAPPDARVSQRAVRTEPLPATADLWSHLGLGTAPLPPSQPCADGTRAVLSLTADGAVGVTAVPMPAHLEVDLPTELTVGDRVTLPWRTAGGPAGEFRVELSGAAEGTGTAAGSPPLKGTTDVLVTAPGTARWSARAPQVERSGRVTVVPADGAPETLTPVPCASGCDVSLQPGGELQVFGAPQQLCAALLQDAAAWMPAEPAGVAHAAAVGSDDALAQAAWVWALEEAGRVAGSRLLALRAAGRLAARGLLAREQVESLLATVDSDTAPTWDAALTPAWRAAALAAFDAPAARALAQTVAAGDSVDARALAADVLGQTGAANAELLSDLLARATQLTPVGTAALARALAQASRPEDARTLLAALPEVVAAAAPVQERAELISAWCSLPTQQATAPQLVGPSGVLNVPADGRVRATESGVHRVTGAWMVARAGRGPPLNRGTLAPSYSAAVVPVGGTLAVTASTARGDGWFQLVAPPGWATLVDNLPSSRRWGGAVWVRASSVEVRLRATSANSVSANAVRHWIPHVDAQPAAGSAQRLRTP